MDWALANLDRPIRSTTWPRSRDGTATTPDPPPDDAHQMAHRPKDQASLGVDPNTAAPAEAKANGARQQPSRRCWPRALTAHRRLTRYRASGRTANPAHRRSRPEPRAWDLGCRHVRATPTTVKTLAKLALACVLAGMLVAALMFPIVGGVGLVVSRASDVVVQDSTQIV